MSSSAKRTIYIVTNFPTAVFQRDVIAGAREICDARGYPVEVVEVAQLPSDPLNHWVRFNEMPPGILVITGVLDDAILENLYKLGVPLSLVSHQIAGGHIPGVMPNNRQGIAMLMEHLVVQHGRRKPVFIQGYATQTDGIQRFTAFQQEVMRYNLKVPPEFYLPGEFTPEVAAASMERFLDEEPDFDSVVAADYLMAEAAMRVIKARGLRVPEDVAVVGFGDAPEAAQAGMTTVAADVTELGRRAARQLIGQTEGLRIRGLTLLSTALLERETTRSRVSPVAK
jgi:DNA-binding LacI/PurR family transcriptional regulator